MQPPSHDELIRTFGEVARVRLMRRQEVSLTGFGAMAVHHEPSQSRETSPGRTELLPPRDVVVFDSRSDLSATTDFIEQIAERLELPTVETVNALGRVVRWMRTQVVEEGEVQIPHLGTLRGTTDDFSFEPSASLAQLVNLRYEGMQPVEVRKPQVVSDDFGEGLEDEVDTEDDFFDDPFASTISPPGLHPGSEELSEPSFEEPVRDLTSEEFAETAEPTPPPFEESELDIVPLDTEGHEDAPSPSFDDDDEEKEREELNRLLEGVWTRPMDRSPREHPLGPMSPDILEDADFQVVPSEMAAEQASDSDDEFPESDSFPDDDLRDLKASLNPPMTPPPPKPDAPRDSAPPPRSRAQTAEWSDKPRRTGGFGLLLLITALVLVATAGLVYWVLVEHPETPATPEPAAEVRTPPPTTDEAAPTDEPETADPVAEEVPATPDTPLRSAAGVDPAAGGFTWVISEASQASASRRVERYRDQGYRVAVLPATVRGTTYYRVAIGQFATRAEAERHRNELPNDVPQDIWVLAL